VIVVVGGAEAHAAKGATARIPIVTIAVSDPVGSRLVASLAKPGGNVTGLMSSTGDELQGKRVELLRSWHPGLVVSGFWPTSPTLARDSGCRRPPLRPGR
jgi:putative ABC transport system substrate-binding protein